jgi:hypothetical protein
MVMSLRGEVAMRHPEVKGHPLREVVLSALIASQKVGENSPAAMARATRAVVEARPGITAGEAFQIVWNIWVV